MEDYTVITFLINKNTMVIKTLITEATITVIISSLEEDTFRTQPISQLKLKQLILLSRDSRVVDDIGTIIAIAIKERLRRAKGIKNQARHNQTLAELQTILAISQPISKGSKFINSLRTIRWRTFGLKVRFTISERIRCLL